MNVTRQVHRTIYIRTYSTLTVQHLAGKRNQVNGVFRHCAVVSRATISNCRSLPTWFAWYLISLIHATSHSVQGPTNPQRPVPPGYRLQRKTVASDYFNLFVWSKVYKNRLQIYALTLFLYQKGNKPLNLFNVVQFICFFFFAAATVQISTLTDHSGHLHLLKCLSRKCAPDCCWN